MSDSIYTVCTCIHIFLNMLILSRQDNNMSITMKLIKIGIYPRISIRKKVWLNQLKKAGLGWNFQGGATFWVVAAVAVCWVSMKSSAT